MSSLDKTPRPPPPTHAGYLPIIRRRKWVVLRKLVLGGAVALAGSLRLNPPRLGFSGRNGSRG